MDSGVETKVYFEDGTEKVINVKTVVVPTTGFDQEDYDKDNTESVNKADVYREDGKTSYYKALNNPTNIASVLTADTLYAYEQDGSDYTLFALNKGNYASNDVKATTTVSYSDKTETFNGTELMMQLRSPEVQRRFLQGNHRRSSEELQVYDRFRQLCSAG